MSTSAHDTLKSVLVGHRARILSSLIRTCGGDFSLAEEALHDAVVVATTQWPQQGLPDVPDTWLLQTARYKAIDRIRHDRRAREKLAQLGREAEGSSYETDSTSIRDDMLRLIFTCCHPALSREAQLALTLRTIAGIPYRVPERTELPKRLEW